MNDLTIKERILETLLESPKTTGKIAIELGYIDDKGHGRYNIIKPDLNTLEQYRFIHRIESNKKSVGAPATTYDIIYELSVIRQIAQKYPLLISDLQKNDKIINLINSYIFDQTHYDPEFAPDSYDYLPNMFRFSPTFFKNFLIDESYMIAFGKIWEEIYVYESNSLTPTHWSLIPDQDLIVFEAFNHSVINDYINGHGNPEAVKLIKTLKQEKLNKSYGEKKGDITY